MNTQHVTTVTSAFRVKALKFQIDRARGATVAHQSITSMHLEIGRKCVFPCTMQTDMTDTAVYSRSLYI